MNTIQQFWHKERREVRKNKERKIQITKKLMGEKTIETKEKEEKKF